MSDFRPVLYVIGVLLCLTSLAMNLPMIIDLAYGHRDWQVFLVSSIFTLIIGIILIFSFNSDLWEIIVLSLYVSITALVLASFFGLLIGYYLALKNFFLKNFILIFLNSLMGIPPVVVGLIVYFMFASGGPLGVLQLLYTPTAMIIAQIIISQRITSKDLF